MSIARLARVARLVLALAGGAAIAVIGAYLGGVAKDVDVAAGAVIGFGLFGAALAGYFQLLNERERRPILPRREGARSPVRPPSPDR